MVRDGGSGHTGAGAPGGDMVRGWRLAWGLATTLVLLATVWPPWIFQGHPHWEQVAWVPLADPSGKPWELIANVLLFVPFGYAGARALRRELRGALLAVALAGLLSLTVEGAQVFAHGRFPSATDLVANLAGAAVGAGLARRQRGGQPADPQDRRRDQRPR